MSENYTKNNSKINYGNGGGGKETVLKMLDAAMVAKNEIIDNDIVVVMLWMEVTEAKQEVE